jgi:hypothetical protein
MCVLPISGGRDAYAAVSKVLGTAKTDVLMIDPYADEKVLRDYSLQTGLRPTGRARRV